ncbi:RNA helicase [Bertholletia excelsa]
MYSSVLLREYSKHSSKLLSLLVFARSVGGGPRTFAGGVNKWHWKRLQEKKAKEKEKRLLDQEKQLYEARCRTEIRAKLAAKSGKEPSDDANYAPKTTDSHIKILADRFVKVGAEGLWNQDEGPRPYVLQQALNKQSIQTPLDLRKLILESRTFHSINLNDSQRPRFYSARARNRAGSGFKFRRNESSETEDSSGPEDDLVRPSSGGPKRWPTFGSRGDDSSNDDISDDEAKEVRAAGNMRRPLTNAALGKYDMKKTKRVPLKFLEMEDNLSEQVDAIRNEVTKRNLMKNAVEESDKDSILSEKRFDECNVSPLTVKALTQAGYVQMTRVQEATLSVCLEGKDALVKAKTGTGKSAAFLLPAIETVLKASGSNKVQRLSPIDVLIICPTRELASQIAAETKVMLRYHDGIGVQTLVGGTRFKDDQKCLESDPCQIIVATPGRLLDHIENKSGFSLRLMGLKMLILDEVDHLLDLGFRKDMEKIVDCLPRKRQSLLFSATIPREVRRISQLVLKREHAYVDTVGLGCLETHAKVKQFTLVAPHDLHFQMVYHILSEHISKTVEYKVIVFCTTAMVTSLMFSLFRELKLNVREIHSRKPQIYRSRISDEFRDSKRLVLISSDVSARGMNYPDVTLVVQVGIPSDREQYIHRLGRTGREGKEGEGILLLAPWEGYFLNEIKDLPIEKLPSPHLDPDVKTKMERSMAKIDTSIKEAAYHAWLGYYNSIGEIGRDKTTLVELANQFSQSIGLEKPPSLFRKTALKMGLKDIPGIRVRK